MKINVSIDTEKYEAVVRMENSDNAEILSAADLYDLVVHDLPLEIAKLVKDSKDETAG